MDVGPPHRPDKALGALIIGQHDISLLHPVRAVLVMVRCYRRAIREGPRATINLRCGLIQAECFLQVSHAISPSVLGIDAHTARCGDGIVQRRAILHPLYKPI
jgi:hypothetical protein